MNIHGVGKNSFVDRLVELCMLRHDDEVTAADNLSKSYDAALAYPRMAHSAGSQVVAPYRFASDTACLSLCPVIWPCADSERI